MRPGPISYNEGHAAGDPGPDTWEGPALLAWPRDTTTSRVSGLLALALLPWLLVAVALYHFRRFELAFLAYHGACFTCFWALGRKSGSWRSALPFLVAALAFAPVATLAVMQFVDLDRLRLVMSGFGFVPWELPLVAAWFLLVHPLAEEAFWRGTIYQGLSRDLPHLWAAGLSSALFGAWHALVLVPFLPSWWWLGTLAVVGFGLAMAALYRARDGELVPCTVFHAVGADLPLLVVLAFAFAA